MTKQTPKTAKTRSTFTKADIQRLKAYIDARSEQIEGCSSIEFHFDAGELSLRTLRPIGE